MPLFRKKSIEAKKRLQHQQYLARESPEPTYDLSGCELSEIPPETFSLCKVLQKEVLLLHNNRLSSIKVGYMKDLLTIRVLDIHNNELTSLPDDLNHLQNLQILNLEGNKLKHLPDSLADLNILQTINLKDNKIKHLPHSICALKSLRSLIISGNEVTRLPLELSQVRTLEHIVLDDQKMAFPNASICADGTAAIMKCLCKASGVVYQPPSRFLLDVLDAPKISPSSNLKELKADVDGFSDTILQYEQMKEKKRLQRLALEKQLEEDQRLQAELSAKNMASKDHLISYINQDRQRIAGELSALQLQKDADRSLLLQAVHQAEKSATHLITHLMNTNEKAKKNEELLEQLEKERMESEQLAKVKAEEISNLRRQDVVNGMQRILEESRIFGQVLQRYSAERQNAARKAQESALETDIRISKVMDRRYSQNQTIVNKLLIEEGLQKEAFELLQLQKDARHSRLQGQIQLIQTELAQLTLLEVEQREMKVEEQKMIIADRRAMLAKLMWQLMNERDNRVHELKKRMAEMEEQREADQVDYWLVQYQRLMDKKPQALIDHSKNLEFAVIDILEAAKATKYVDTFARHRISIETMLQLNDTDLNQMGVKEVGLRKAILLEIDRYRKQTEEEIATRKLKGLDVKDEKLVVLPRKEPSAPTTPSAEALQTDPMPIKSITARGMNTECVICMDSMSLVIFLDCGHICTCTECSEKVEDCPMCRSKIVQRIQL